MFKSIIQVFQLWHKLCSELLVHVLLKCILTIQATNSEQAAYKYKTDHMVNICGT
jgi:hypothetical protein